MLRKGLKILVVDPDLDYWRKLEEKADWLVELDICFTKNQLNKNLKCNVYSMIFVNLDFYKTELIGNRYSKIRKLFDGPIVFLTDEADAETRVKWLKLGIYDVWSKRLTYQELQYKIIRICELETGQYTYEIDIYTINESKREIWQQGEKLKLAPIPYKLLLYLLRNPNCDLSREVLLKQVWNYEVSAGDRVVDKNINTIRKCTNDYRIRSVYGSGYRFELEVNEKDEKG